MPTQPLASCAAVWAYRLVLPLASCAAGLSISAGSAPCKLCRGLGISDFMPFVRKIRKFANICLTLRMRCAIVLLREQRGHFFRRKCFFYILMLYIFLYTFNVIYIYSISMLLYIFGEEILGERRIIRYPQKRIIGLYVHLWMFLRFILNLSLRVTSRRL